MLRKIIEIDQNKCNGCGLCVNACHEGAIQLVNGKASLISDEYCDGLGDCLPECPVDAIQIIEREAADYNEELVKAKMQANAAKHQAQTSAKLPCGCPGTLAAEIKKAPVPSRVNLEDERPSELRQWPVQLNLINPQASYLQHADLLIAADCTAYAYASFHEKFMRDRITMIGCPKLDDNDYYTEKIEQILKINNPKSVKVIRMDVPCCSGIVRAVRTAMDNAGISVPYSEVIINSQGQIL
ncbi:4Fe-4S binding protein [Dehalobacter sp. DCM]|uniref:ATP-binding protein n=1 Tax=Dehalobacter sp. DCM TaxID=2907827 RepID=UPI003081914C|nr:4Fe-4S binding protein [Dehalobacter sp. DCM]